MMHIKEDLLLIRKNSPCGRSRFHYSLSEWSFTICLTPNNCKYNVLSVSLNKHFLPSVLISLPSHTKLVGLNRDLLSVSVNKQFNFIR